jgi:hypothetical protein
VIDVSEFMLFENNRRKEALANGLSEAQMLSKQREKRDKETKEESDPQDTGDVESRGPTVSVA